MSGILPIFVVSAAPTTATDFLFMVCASRGFEERQRDRVALPGETDAQGHVEDERFGRLRAIDDVRHHARTFGKRDDGDRIRLVAHVGAWAVVDDVGIKDGLAARGIAFDGAAAAARTEGARREVAAALAFLAAL